MSNTQDNLQSAFAEQAGREGQTVVARLFRAAAEAETVHARNHMQAMEGIKSTKDNLVTAMGGENYEFTAMYPGFIARAQAEQDNRAFISFFRANAVEKIHHSLYQEAIKALESGQNLDDKPFFVCQVCGNTVAGATPDKCTVCGAASSEFKKVE